MIFRAAVRGRAPNNVYTFSRCHTVRQLSSLKVRALINQYATKYTYDNMIYRYIRPYKYSYSWKACILIGAGERLVLILFLSTHAAVVRIRYSHGSYFKREFHRLRSARFEWLTFLKIDLLREQATQSRTAEYLSSCSADNLGPTAEVSHR